MWSTHPAKQPLLAGKSRNKLYINPSLSQINQYSLFELVPTQHKGLFVRIYPLYSFWVAFNSGIIGQSNFLE